MYDAVDHHGVRWGTVLVNCDMTNYVSDDCDADDDDFDDV